MGSIKDRNGMDLTEAEDIKKRWKVYREELYKKDLHDADNHDGMIIIPAVFQGAMFKAVFKLVLPAHCLVGCKRILTRLSSHSMHTSKGKK